MTGSFFNKFLGAVGLPRSQRIHLLLHDGILCRRIPQGTPAIGFGRPYAEHILLYPASYMFTKFAVDVDNGLARDSICVGLGVHQVRFDRGLIVKPCWQPITL